MPKNIACARVVLLLLTLVALHAPPARALDTGSGNLEYVSPGQYLTLKSDELWLRFDVQLEGLARKLFPRMNAHLQKLQRELGFKLNRPLPLFLIRQNFGNAFVQYATLSSPAFSVISSRLPAV